MADMSVEERTLKVQEDCLEQFARLPIYLAERLADVIATAITEAVEAERAACAEVARRCDWAANEAIAQAIEARAEKPVAADMEGE